MNRYEKNQYAETIVADIFKENGYKIEQTNLPRVEVNFNVLSPKEHTMKIKVKVITQIGSYVFNEKTKFDIRDPDLNRTVPVKPPKNIYIII